MFRNKTFQRATASVLLVTLSSLTLAPLAQARAAYVATQGSEPDIKATSRTDSFSAQPDRNEQYARVLESIHEELKPGMLPMSSTAIASHSNKAEVVSVAAKAKRIRVKHEELKALAAEVEKSFSDTEQHLKKARLSQEILDRHAVALNQFQGRRADFERLMRQVEQSQDESTEQANALAALSAFMNSHRSAKPHQFGNPARLPFGTSNSKPRKPNVTAKQYQEKLFPPKFNPILLAGPIPDGLTFKAAALPDLPNAGDLAATEDAQISPAIRELAASLQNNPVKIYDWVRNNVQFIPSYGSIQGSEVTLGNKRGNAYDTASLLVALYRASGIPARYVYGTVDVPAAKVMNWVGGVTKPEAAQSLLSQGGIPNVGLVSGGEIKWIRMEHVWVQAYVDFSPSRGALNRKPDTWVPMDPSFKQYQFTRGMALAESMAFKSEDFAAQIQQGATVDSEKGYVQNLNYANMKTQMNAYQTQVAAFINGQKPNATIAEVLGAQIIKAESHELLVGTLPYKTVFQGGVFQSYPDSLKWKFKTNIYPDDGISDSSSPIIELNQSTASLAGKKITLSFIPASSADLELINSYLPKPHADGSPIQLNEFPKSLPGYLLRLKAELRVDGQVVALSAQSFAMGSQLKQSNQYFDAAISNWAGGEDNDITVGEYDAIGLDLQGVGLGELHKLRERVAATMSKLDQFKNNPADPTPISGLSKEELNGDMAQIGILGYFAQVDNMKDLADRVLGNVISYRLPSYGRFYSDVTVQYFFGLPRNVSVTGLGLDIDYFRTNIESKDGNQEIRTAQVARNGRDASAAENLVPEWLMADPQLAPQDARQPKGVSAMSALAMAGVAGQKIYRLAESNRALHSSILQDLQVSNDVKRELADALAIGMEVTVHEKNITVNGWTGAGYIITDPVTGSGAYKISGGANGGMLSLVSGFGLGASSAATLYLAGALAPIWALPVGIGLALMIGLIVATALYNLRVWAADPGCFWQGVGIGGFAVGNILAVTGITSMLASIGTMPAARNVRSMISEAIAGFVSSFVGGSTGIVAASNTVQSCGPQ